MKTYTITFKNGTIQEVSAERYLDVNERLILLVGHQEVARYMRDDVSGIKESDKLPGPVYGNPSERRKRR